MDEKQDSTQPQPNSSTKTLYRSEKTRIIAGVAGGLGEYLNIDPVIFRILFVVFALFQGSGILLYLVLWVVMPTQSKVKVPIGEQTVKENVQEIKAKAQVLADEMKPAVQQLDHSKYWWGFILIVLGLWLLSRNFGWLAFFDLTKLWPLIPIGLGIMFLLK